MTAVTTTTSAPTPAERRRAAAAGILADWLWSSDPHGAWKQVGRDNRKTAASRLRFVKFRLNRAGLLKRRVELRSRG